jgi:hypothetical protein
MTGGGGEQGVVSVFVSAVNHYQTNQTIISMEYRGLFSHCMSTEQSDHDDGREGQLLGFWETFFLYINILILYIIFAKRSHLVFIVNKAFLFSFYIYLRQKAFLALFSFANIHKVPQLHSNRFEQFENK